MRWWHEVCQLVFSVCMPQDMRVKTKHQTYFVKCYVFLGHILKSFTKVIKLRKNKWAKTLSKCPLYFRILLVILLSSMLCILCINCIIYLCIDCIMHVGFVRWGNWEAILETDMKNTVCLSKLVICYTVFQECRSQSYSVQCAFRLLSGSECIVWLYIKHVGFV